MYGKAQGSFELLLLVAFVVSLSLILASFFFQENDKTRIEALAKSIVLEGLSKQSVFYFVNEVEYFVDNGIPKLNVCLKPSTQLSSNNEIILKNALSQKTKINASNIVIKYTDTQAC